MRRDMDRRLLERTVKFARTLGGGEPQKLHSSASGCGHGSCCRTNMAPEKALETALPAEWGRRDPVSTSERRSGRALRIWRANALALALLLGCSGLPTETTHHDNSSAHVVGVTRRLSTTLLTLHAGSSSLVTTPEHPFAKVGSGWTPAGALAVGDEIETHNGGTTRISAIATRQVTPTPVYNLTVAKTHAYFVGSDSLLVHNLNCLRPRLSRQEREQRQARIEQEQEHRRIRRLVEEHRRQLNRPSINDSTGPIARYNCAYCTFAILDDAKNLSSFLARTGLDQHADMTDRLIWRELVRLHLAGVEMQWRGFSPDGLKARMRDLLETQIATDSLESRLIEHNAVVHMKEAAGNTHVLTYETWERLEEPPGSGRYVMREEGHALVAIRKDDGQIVYIDPQTVPPSVRQRLPNGMYEIGVFPTSVDWRSNRQLYAALRDGGAL